MKPKFKRPLRNLLRDRNLLLRLRLPCSLYSRTGALLEANFGLSLQLCRGLFNPSTLAKLELRGFKQFVAAGLLSFGVFFAQDAASELPKFASKPEFVGVVEELSVNPALFSTQSFEWMDVERQRVVPAKLYIPVGPLKTGEVPLVVFSHGIGGSKESYRYLGSYFAAHGYASLHVQHVGSDRQIWRGNPFSIVTRLTDAAQEGEALNRVNDVKFALNQILAEPVGSAIDASRLVAAGHSYGANTTMLLAGARVNVKGMPTSVKDPRFSAAILISAPPFYGMGDPQKILSDIDIPSLHITATADDINIPGYNSGVADRLAVYAAIGATTHVAKVLACLKTARTVFLQTVKVRAAWHSTPKSRWLPVNLR